MSDIATIQKLMLPHIGICTEEELYFRKRGNTFFNWKERKFELNTGGILDFDTYFNMFSAGKWYKYTMIQDFGIRLRLRGVFEIKIFDMQQCYGNMRKELIHVERIDTKGKTEEKMIPIGRTGKNRQYTFQVTAKDENCFFYSGEYVSLQKMQTRDISIAIIFCTYRREKYITDNLRRFVEYRKNKEDYSVEIYVVDNGKSLNAETLECGWIHLFPNMNAGGSGGYTRGMLELIEVQKKKKITHCILMDDDIVIDPAVVERTIYFLQYVKQEYYGNPFGGAMLRNDVPYIQFENGGKIHGDKVMPVHSGYDLRNPGNCIQNERLTFSDYNAWWYCAIPMEYVREDNLPMPVFVRYDDVEYGTRIGKEPILLNGVCVWHDSFENKYSSSMLYYDYRNNLIMTSVRQKEYNLQKVIQDVKKAVDMEILLYRYENAVSILAGIQDFLKGPEWLMKQNPEELHRQISKNGYKLSDADGLEISLDISWYHICCAIEDCDKLHKWVRYISQNGRLLPADRTVIIPIYGARPVQLYRAAAAMHYNENTNQGFVTVKDTAKYRQCKKMLKQIIFQLKRDYVKVKNEYVTYFPILSSARFWRNYLQIEKQGENENVKK